MAAENNNRLVKLKKYMYWMLGVILIFPALIVCALIAGFSQRNPWAWQNSGPNLYHLTRNYFNSFISFFFYSDNSNKVTPAPTELNLAEKEIVACRTESDLIPEEVVAQNTSVSSEELDSQSKKVLEMVFKVIDENALKPSKDKCSEYRKKISSLKDSTKSSKENTQKLKVFLKEKKIEEGDSISLEKLIDCLYCLSHGNSLDSNENESVGQGFNQLRLESLSKVMKFCDNNKMIEADSEMKDLLSLVNSMIAVEKKEAINSISENHINRLVQDEKLTDGVVTKIPKMLGYLNKIFGKIDKANKLLFPSTESLPEKTQKTSATLDARKLVTPEENETDKILVQKTDEESESTKINTPKGKENESSERIISDREKSDIQNELLKIENSEYRDNIKTKIDTWVAKLFKQIDENERKPSQLACSQFSDKVDLCSELNRHIFGIANKVKDSNTTEEIIAVCNSRNQFFYKVDEAHKSLEELTPSLISFWYGQEEHQGMLDRVNAVTELINASIGSFGQISETDSHLYELLKNIQQLRNPSTSDKDKQNLNEEIEKQLKRGGNNFISSINEIIKFASSKFMQVDIYYDQMLNSIALGNNKKVSDKIANKDNTITIANVLLKLEEIKENKKLVSVINRVNHWGDVGPHSNNNKSSQLSEASDLLKGYKTQVEEKAKKLVKKKIGNDWIKELVQFQLNGVEALIEAKNELDNIKAEGEDPRLTYYNALDRKLTDLISGSEYKDAMNCFSGFNDDTFKGISEFLLDKTISEFWNKDENKFLATEKMKSSLPLITVGVMLVKKIGVFTAGNFKNKYAHTVTQVLKLSHEIFEFRNAVVQNKSLAHFLVDHSDRMSASIQGAADRDIANQQNQTNDQNNEVSGEDIQTVQAFLQKTINQYPEFSYGLPLLKMVGHFVGSIDDKSFENIAKWPIETTMKENYIDNLDWLERLIGSDLVKHPLIKAFQGFLQNSLNADDFDLVTFKTELVSGLQNIKIDQNLISDHDNAEKQKNTDIQAEYNKLMALAGEGKQENSMEQMKSQSQSNNGNTDDRIADSAKALASKGTFSASGKHGGNDTILSENDVNFPILGK